MRDYPKSPSTRERELKLLNSVVVLLVLASLPTREHDKSLRGHPAFGLADGLILGSHFVPCPWW